jgi:hypothetical protein
MYATVPTSLGSHYRLPLNSEVGMATLAPIYLNIFITSHLKPKVTVSSLPLVTASTGKVTSYLGVQCTKPRRYSFTGYRASQNLVVTNNYQ